MFGKDMALGVKVSVKSAKIGETALKGTNIIEKLQAAGFSLEGGNTALSAGSKYEFSRVGLGLKGRVGLAWHHNVAAFSEGGIPADVVSTVFTKSPLKNLPVIASAMRPDGTLNPMSWWSRGVQIGKGLGLPGKLEEDFQSGAPAAASLG
jgi:hypothetical protein